MAFVKADKEKERKELERLVLEDKEAKGAYEEFQARVAQVAVRKQLVERSVKK